MSRMTALTTHHQVPRVSFTPTTRWQLWQPERVEQRRAGEVDRSSPASPQPSLQASPSRDCSRPTVRHERADSSVELVGRTPLAVLLEGRLHVCASMLHQKPSVFQTTSEHSHQSRRMSPSSISRSTYNTTAPMYGVSLTSGQPVTIVQKFPDLLQQVIYETCE